MLFERDHTHAPSPPVAGLNCGIHCMRGAIVGWTKRAMRTRAGRFAATLHKWLQIAAVILMLAFVAIAVVWSIDPPWRVTELQGAVVGWGKQETPNVVIRYYKMLLYARTDDGRNIAVSSERRVPPKLGERILVQERLGLFGTRSFVELPTP